MDDSMRNQDRGPAPHNTEGDSAQGAPQLETTGGSHDRDTEFFVNQTFINRYGMETAERYKAIVEEVGRSVDSPEAGVVRDALAPRLAEAGIEVPDVELNKIADRIAASVHTQVDVEDLGH